MIVLYSIVFDKNQLLCYNIYIVLEKGDKRMANSSLTIELLTRGLRVYGGNKSDVIAMTSMYKNIKWSAFHKMHPTVSRNDFKAMHVYGIERVEREKKDVNEFSNLFYNQFPLTDKGTAKLYINSFKISCLTPKKYMRQLLGAMNNFNRLAPQYSVVRFWCIDNKVFMTLKTYYLTSDHEGYNYTDGKLLLKKEDIVNNRDSYAPTVEGAVAKAKKLLHKYVKDKSLRKLYVKELNNLIGIKH